MARSSHHIEPHGSLQIAQHYVRELVYGANDGIITTFAVVAGVSGGGLPVLEAQQLPEEETSPFRHGLATFAAFVGAGVLPLVPYMIPGLPIDRFALSSAFTLLALFGVGASRALIANVPWWRGGFEMLALGAIVAAAAYYSGAAVAAMLT